MKSDTVFGHLVHQFSIHPENLATEALCFILRTSPAASRAFTEFIHQIGFDCPGDLYFETQRGGSAGCIPDMKCYDDEKRLRVIVENKFGASLTRNQPVTYIDLLPSGVTAVLLFVVPEARLQILWKEVIALCKAVEKPSTIQVAHLDEEHYIAVTSWRTLLNALSEEAPLDGEIDRRNDIAQLQGLCRRMDEEEFLPLVEEELSSQSMAQRFINYSDLAFNIINEAKIQGLFKNVRAQNSKYSSGASVEIGEYIAWIGFNPFAWRRKGVSPIWLAFHSYARMAQIREKLTEYRRVKPQRCFDSEDGRFVMVPIVLKAGVDKKYIIKEAIDQIGELVAKLGVQISLITPPVPNPTDNIDEDPEYNPESETNE
jgi:hypothetical protein